MDIHLHIRLLGDFSIFDGAEPVLTINTPRLQALLTYLLVHSDAPQPRQQIAFLFWPDSSEAQAQSNLRNLLAALRRALPRADDYIAIERRTVQWVTGKPFTLDVIDFQAALAEVARQSDTSMNTAGGPTPERMRSLRRAVELYGGDLLPGCYDEWIAAPREKLREDFLAALQELISSHEHTGDNSTAILYARRLLRHDPLQEENYRQLMRLHMANGDHSAAIGVYRACQTMLERDLGVEPSPVTRELARQIEEAMGAPVSTRSEEKRRRTSSRSGPGAETAHDAIPNNLPAPTTPFVGRERDVSILTDMLAARDVRLITLTGTPGTGKTRLALQVASGLAARPQGLEHTFADGIYFVSLAAVTEADLVVSGIAQALGMPEPGGRAVRDALLEHLRNKRLLLVLDNFEHLLPASPLISDLLSGCPRLKVLVTSQATLNLRGEHEYPVPTLSVPGREAPLQPEDLAQYESVALFVERAVEVSPGFSLMKENARAVIEICRRLEGLPLAIELAAVRVKVLSPDAILSRLDRRLKLLVGGRSDLPPRQRALETAIAWSYNLLDHAEQALFRKLSVFSGGCTLESAEGITEDANVLDGISALLNKSLLQATPEGNGAPRRFSMLETVKEYASEQLEAQSETEAARRAHARFFLDLAEKAGREIISPQQIAWLELLEAEHDNLRAALRWALDTGEGETALRLCTPLARFWERRGHRVEGRRWITAALAIDVAQERTIYRAEALHGLSFIESRLGNLTPARAAIDEALSIFRDLDDKQGIAQSLNILGLIATEQADYASARAFHEQSLAISRELGNTWGIANSTHSLGLLAYYQSDLERAYALVQENVPRWREIGDKWGIAGSLRLLANICDDRQDFEQARQLYRECLEIYREMGNRWGIAWTLHDLGDIEWRFENYDEAEPLHRENLRIFEEIGDKTGIAMSLHRLARIAYDQGRYEQAAALFRQSLSVARELDNKPVISFSVGGLAGVAAVQGRLKTAATLFGAAQAVLDSIGSDLESAGVAKSLPAARTSFGEQAWESAWAEGQSMPFDRAVELAETI